MNGETIQILVAMIAYMAAVIAIGVMFAKKANKNSENYFLGGRSLGPWVTAMSAEASDMSGWLLMGLPGLAYWCGLADAFWTAFGLVIGTYLNWLIVSRRLRRYSIRTENAITLPEFFSKRFRESKNVVGTLAALFILIFFAVYAASCFVTCGKLFSTLFGAPYIPMMIVGAVFVLAYTIIGGFLAESASDFMQGIVMFFALGVIVILGVVKAGGLDAVIENAQSIPGFLEFFGLGNPLNAAGESIAGVTSEALKADPSLNVQAVVNGTPAFGEARSYSILNVFSMLAWGLGYFGMPQVLLRFMAIRKEGELKMSRRIAMVWVVISLGIAVFIGILGRYLYPVEHLTNSSAEGIFMTLSTSFLPPILAGLVMAGILAATISSSDSYLLIAASAFSKNIYQGVLKKDASDKQVMRMSRITLLVIALFAIIIALDENSVIFKVVSFAWAGFGATFGPLMLFSLFWKRVNRPGAIAGMISGAAMVFIWKLGISKLGGVFAIYELLPAFIISSVVIVVVSLLTAPPSKEIEEDFEAVKAGNIEE